MIRLWSIGILVSFALALPLVAGAGAGPVGPAARASVTEFPLPHPESRPYSIVRGPDRALWFTESNRGVIGRITPSGDFKEFALPNAGSGPYGITLGADGNLWFTERFADTIAMMNTAGAVTEFCCLTPMSQPWDIAALPDGSLWFTEENVDQVGQIYPNGAIYEFPTGPGELPTSIAAGPGGTVWFTKELGNKIVKLTPGPNPGDPPDMAEYPLLTEGALPWDIAAGPDGNMWFTTLAARIIGKVTPNGTITEYPVPGEYGIAGIAWGPSDRMWFTENDTGLVGSITTDGVVEERFGTSPYPFGITYGPDGNMWFAGGYGNTIGRLSLRHAAASSPLRARRPVLSNSSRTLAESGIPGRSPGEGTGVPYDVTIGTTPAQVSSAASGESSSSGGPVRTLADASSISIARIVVALSSCAFGCRTSSHLPGRSFSVNASNAARRSASSSIRSKVPKAITES